MKNNSGIIASYGNSDVDSGSTAVQIAFLTERVKLLTKHCCVHKGDKSSERGLQMIVAKRKKLLRYLKRKSLDDFKSVATSLKIRQRGI